ncbi:MAG: hypothetical protein IT582_03825 [Opitutaceae bacterium]|nr:hypothetical protein [Opitutaceae bacterium]
MADSDPAAPRILIAEDQTDVSEAIRLLFKPERYGIGTVSPPEFSEIGTLAATTICAVKS